VIGALREASRRESAKRRRDSLGTRSPPGAGDEVADVVADPLWVHYHRPAAQRWGTKRREDLPVELRLVVSHL